MYMYKQVLSCAGCVWSIIPLVSICRLQVGVPGSILAYGVIISVGYVLMMLVGF